MRMPTTSAKSRAVAVALLSFSLLGCGGPSSGSEDSAGTTGEQADSTGDATESSDDASSGLEDEATGSESGDDPTQADQSGEEIFAALCAGCHGADAGGTQLGYELRHHDMDHLEWVVRNGRPGTEFPGSVMAAHSEEVLPAESLDKIWSYLDAFPQPETGEGLYLDYCGNCHGASGAGGVVGAEINDEDWDDIEEHAREGAGLDDVGERGGFMPAFETDRLSDAELELIADFILL